MIENLLIVLISVPYAFVAVITLAVLNKENTNFSVVFVFSLLFLIAPLSAPYMIWQGTVITKRERGEG
jgi:hypothetical protein